MLTRRWDKAKRPSRHVTVGSGWTPHGRYYYAMGRPGMEVSLVPCGMTAIRYEGPQGGPGMRGPRCGAEGG